MSWSAKAAPACPWKLFTDPVTAQCVASLRWRELCDSENQAADRARFVELYDKLAAQKSEGVTRKLVGFEMTVPGIARDGFDVYIDDEKCGVVTSGSPAPFLKKNIGLAFVPTRFANVGQEINIDVRGKQLAAKIVPTPFYKRNKN